MAGEEKEKEICGRMISTLFFSNLFMKPGKRQKMLLSTLCREKEGKRNQRKKESLFFFSAISKANITQQPRKKNGVKGRQRRSRN